MADADARVRSRFILWFAVLSAVVGILFYASFFRGVMSGAAEWTGSGFVWTIQCFHNFLHGRPFQSSLYAVPAASGSSVGFVRNPYAFINTNTIHVNWTPYLFAFVWGLHPTPAWMYGIQVLWTLVMTAYFSISILRRLDPRDWREKSLFACSVLASCGLLSILNQMGQLLVFAGPVMLALYDAALARRRGWFVFWTLFLCFTAEDAAMVAVTFGAYFFLFERERRREGIVAMGIATAYLAFVLGILQPASRADLTVTAGSTAVSISRKLMEIDLRNLRDNVFSLYPLAPFAPAMGLMLVLYAATTDRARLLRLAGLALVPAAPHWGEVLIVGGAHHLFPPFFGLFLCLLVMLGETRIKMFDRRAAAGWLIVYGLVSMRVLAGNLPPEAKLPFFRRLRPNQAHALETALLKERESNGVVIAAARALPADASLCYLGNVRPMGYIADRSSIWEFPHYYAETAYVLVQKDANDVNTPIFLPTDRSLSESLSHPRPTGVREASLPASVADLIKKELVGSRRTHRVAREDEHILLLENLSPRTPVSPPATVGFGWIRNIGR